MCLWQLMGGFIRDNVRRHLGRHVFESLGRDYTTMLERGAVLVVLWLILLWMYRRASSSGSDRPQRRTIGDSPARLSWGHSIEPPDADVAKRDGAVVALQEDRAGSVGAVEAGSGAPLTEEADVLPILLLQPHAKLGRLLAFSAVRRSKAALSVSP